MTSQADHRICNYEGSAYRTEFWDGGRDYEDAAERVALRRLLPPAGDNLIDIGGGYGRLVPLYAGYAHVIIFDYALTQLRQAQEMWGSAAPGGSPRYTYVAGDFYHLPFAPGTFDTIVMVRTLHHATDAPSVLRGVSSLLAPHGSLVLEFANKRNLKAIFRYLMQRQDWSPFDREPVEFVALNFDFHPAWIDHVLMRQGLRIRQRRAVSSFRVAPLKRTLPTPLLVQLDRLCQPLGGLFPLSPSVFLRCEAPGDKSRRVDGTFFRCTACGSTDLQADSRSLTCSNCGTVFPIQNSIYNFKQPLLHGQDIESHNEQ